MKILVVDDHPETVYLLTVLLEGNGHAVTIARHGAEALEKARQSPPEVVISDLLMPVMDGFTLLRHWRADPRLAQIPFLVFTATYTDPEDEKLALKLGADAYLLKPAEPEVILRWLEESCRLDRQRSQHPPPQAAEENDLLLVYNQTLVRKLEQKALELEETNRQLEEDIAARKKAEAASHLFQSAVLQAGEAILITEAQLDPPGPKIVFVNPAFCTLTGYSAQEVLGKTPRILQGPDTNRAVLAELRKRLEAGLPFRGSTINYRKDRTPYHVEWHIAPIRNAEGQITHFVGIQRDITEQIEREKRLSEALAREQVLAEKALAGDRAKSEFLAVMSHEIRTPLNSILGFSELLSQNCELPEECREFIGIIHSSGQSLLRIIDDVLDFSQLEAGRMQTVAAPFSPEEVFAEIRHSFAAEAAAKGLSLQLSLPHDAPEQLVGDAGRLRQVLLNLVGNAIKFTESGTVTFGWRSAPDGAGQEFFVRDTGPGIAPTEAERIFQPFTQADASISRRHGGTGLGLAICRRLADLLGGRLDLSSELGRGTEFILHLQLPAPEQARPPKIPTTPAHIEPSFAEQYPLKILVVEDDRVNRKLTLTLLEKLGYQPLAEENGAAALALCQTQPMDCIFMDLHMPELDGIEATRQLRARERAAAATHRTFIAALTANIFPADRERCIQVGMDDYLNKPIQLLALRQTLQKAAQRQTLA